MLRDAFGDDFGARLVTPSDDPLSEAEVRAMVQKEREMGDGRQYASNGLVVNEREVAKDLGRTRYVDSSR